MTPGTTDFAGFTPECVELIKKILAGSASGNRVGQFYVIEAEITPELASYLLSVNIANNRSLKSKNTDAAVADIQEDNWRASVSEILVTWNGKLIDGQHRLTAVVRSGKSQRFMVRFGLEEEDIKALDQGTPRRVGEQLAILHPDISGTEATDLAAIAKRILHYRETLPKVLTGRSKFPVNTANTNAYKIWTAAQQNAEISANLGVYRQARAWGRKIENVNKKMHPWNHTLWGTAAVILLETDPSSVEFLRELARDGVTQSMRVAEFLRVARDRASLHVTPVNATRPEQLWKFTAALSFTFHAYNMWRENPNNGFGRGLGPCDLSLTSGLSKLEFQFPVGHPAYVKPRITNRAAKGTSL